MTCNRCGATSPTTHTEACRRRERLLDFAVAVACAPVAVVFWPIGMLLNGWDRLWRRT